MISFRIFTSLKDCSDENIKFVEQSVAQYQDQRIIDLSKKTLQIIFSYRADRVLGFILFDTDYDNRQRNYTAFIKFSFVLPLYRGKGIFSQMLNLLEDHTKKLNFSAVAIEVNRDDSFFIDILNKKKFNLILYRTWKLLNLSNYECIRPEIIRSNNMSDVFSFFLRETADLIDMGFTSPMTTWKDSKCESIYIRRQDEIIACIVYSTEYVDAEKYLFIELSAVKKSYRRQGLYRILHSAFEQIAKEKGCLYISSHVSKKNLVRLESCKKVGLEARYHFLGKSIL